MTRVLFGVWAFSTTSMLDGARQTYVVLAEDNSAPRTALWLPNLRLQTVLGMFDRDGLWFLRGQTELNMRFAPYLANFTRQ